MSRFRHDQDTGLYLPRERRIEALSPRLCSMGAPQQALLMRGGATVAAAASIYPNLISWWSMNDSAASAVIDDSHSTNDLQLGGSASFNTSTYTVTGQVSSALQVNNNSATKFNIMFPSVDNTLLDFTGDVSFTAGGWFKSTVATNPNTFQRYFGRLRGSNAQGGWGIYRPTSTSNIRADIVLSSSSSVSTSVIAITSTNWNWIVYRYNAATDELSLRVNSTTNTSTAAGGVYAGGTGSNAPASFSIGRMQPRGGSMDITGTMQDFYVDEFFAASAALSDSELDYLYNSGTGRSYAQLAADSGH